MADPPSQPDPDQEPSGPEPSPSVAPAAVEFLTLGVAWAVVLAAGGGLGYLIDQWLSTAPVFTLIGLVLGVVGAVLVTISRVRRYL